MLDDDLDREVSYFFVGMNEEGTGWNAMYGIYFKHDSKGNVVKVKLSFHICNLVPKSYAKTDA